VDAYLAIVSKREVRRYSYRPLPEDVVQRILEAGRISGSSQNRQPWRFVLVEKLRDQVAETVYEPTNVRGAALVIALAMRGRGPTGFDSGRVAQNMMLAAWNDGVGSCPNGVADGDALRALLDLPEDEKVSILLTFGYPERPVDPQARSAPEWIERARRRDLAEIVSRR
jgi:nitroreductase